MGGYIFAGVGMKVDICR